MKERTWHHRITPEYYFLKPYLLYDSSKGRGERLTFNKELIDKDFSKEYIFSRIMALDEPIVRGALLDEYKNLFGELNASQEIDSLCKRIEELKKQMANN